MNEFTYKALNDRGQSVQGAIEAPDRRTAIAELSRQGLLATEVAERLLGAGERRSKAAVVEKETASVLSLGRGVSRKDILSFTSQLSTGLQAGLAILDVLEIIHQQQTRPNLKHVVAELKQAVSGGESLSDALERHPECFGSLYISMVRVGETGGILEQTLGQLTKLMEREEKVRSNLANASAYPLFVLGIGIASAVLVVTYILPRIIDTLGEGVEVMPMPTRVLMFISDVLVNFGWLILLGILACAVLFVQWKKTPAGRLQWDTFKFRLPLLGPVLRSIAVGRFARTLGALTKSGITILEALRVVRDTLNNELLARQIDEVAVKVKAGQTLAEPLSQSGLFPPLLVQIVSMGEHTGKLDELLLGTADTFDNEADAVLTRFMSVFPALLILLLALVIGFLIAATLLPIVVMELGSI